MSTSPRNHYYCLSAKFFCVVVAVLTAGWALLYRPPRRFHHMSKQQQEEPKNKRTYQTVYDIYFQQHDHLPLPPTVHAVFNKKSSAHTAANNTLVIGDVHGCFLELQQLLKKARYENGNVDFDSIVFVGDLVNKGVNSTETVQWIRAQQEGGHSKPTSYHVVRGNHEDKVLQVSFEEGQHRRLKKHDNNKNKHIKKKYRWLFDPESLLTDDDVTWLAELPYTLTLPSLLVDSDGKSRDVLVVHGGLIPGLDLHKQPVESMINLREVTLNETTQEYQFHDRTQKGGIAWASVWNGDADSSSTSTNAQQPHVVFGHDASRSLQLYDGATGLDTGAVYGRQLTGLILPEQKLVQVDSVRDYTHI